MAEKKKRNLTKKQRAFVEAYLQCWNATEAARKAGYSERSIRSIAAENLAKPDIAEEIQERIDELVMSANEALIRLSEIARAEYSEYITSEGEVDLEQLKADGKMHLIKAIYETKYGKKIEFHSVEFALDRIGKHHGQFVERHEHTGPGGGPIVYLPAIQEDADV